MLRNTITYYIIADTIAGRGLKRNPVRPNGIPFGEKESRLAKRDPVRRKRIPFDEKESRMTKRNSVWPKRIPCDEKGSRLAKRDGIWPDGMEFWGSRIKISRMFFQPVDLERKKHSAITWRRS